MVGIDIEDISRFKKLFLKKPNLTRRLFSVYEWDYAINKNNPHHTLAGFWCAKEAVVKAFSSIELLSMNDVHITHLKNGAPRAVILKSHIENNYKVHLSISHSSAQATAVAFINQLSKLKQ